MELHINDKAPVFSGLLTDGTMFNLNDFQGKKIVLYFYPKDDTPGCTKQACNLRDNYNKLQEQGFEIFGISPDDTASHRKFIEKYNLPFQLIMDEDLSISKLFGTWGKKNLYGREYIGMKRTTYIINEEGVITAIIKRVITKDHTEQILKK